MPSTFSRPPSEWSRRRLLMGVSAVSAGGILVGVAPNLFAGSAVEAVSLPTFRRAGDLDDTASLFRAAQSGRPIHAPAGKGNGPDGSYMVAMTAEDDLPSGFELFGDGIGKTVFLRSYARQAPFILHADSRSADPARNLAGIRLRDLSFEDEVAKRGFSGYDYLVMLSGVTGARIERVGFRGFRGDGLYIGSSTIRAQERHNHDVLVTGCRFDGVNGNNRNGISILDADGLRIEKCSFVNVSRAGGPGAEDPMNPLTGLQMPGAIDIEPENTGFARVRNVTISDNRFSGGGGYAVTLNLFPNAGAVLQGFRIENNQISDRWGGFSGNGFAGGDATAPTAHEYAILFRNNEVRGCEKAFFFDGMRGLTLQENRFFDCAQQAELGYHAASADVVLIGNRFERIGYAQGFGLWIRANHRLRIERNTFVDCGLKDGSRGIPIAFVQGESREVALLGNQIESPTGRTTEATTVFSDGKVDRATLRVSGNRITGRVVRGPTALF